MTLEKEQEFGVVLTAVSIGVGAGTGQPEVAIGGGGLGVGWFLAASRGDADDVDESTQAVWEHGETQIPESSLLCRLLGHSPIPSGIVRFDGETCPSARCSRCGEFRVLPEDSDS